jgi:hypothetical protein
VTAIHDGVHARSRWDGSDEDGVNVVVHNLTCSGVICGTDRLVHAVRLVAVRISLL